MKTKAEKREQCIKEINKLSLDHRGIKRCHYNNYKAGEHTTSLAIKDFEITNMICEKYELNPLTISKIRQFEYDEIKGILLNRNNVL